MILTELQHRPRFIPACAGFWHRGYSAGPADQVHPRVCGVLSPCALPRRMRLGSSPRVRGFVAGSEAAIKAKRFIPACAGF